MRGSTAFFLAGAAAIVSGTVAPAFSAEDPVRVTPAPAAEEASGEPPVDAVDADQGSGDAVDGGLARPSLEPAIDERSREGEMARSASREDSAGSKQPLANASVTMKNIEFKPKTLTIDPGDRVTWTNRDTAQHNAVERREEFQTRLLDKGESASVTIDGAGTYNYVCTVHDGMNGKLVARSSGGGSSGGTGGSSGSTGGTGSSAGSTSGSTFPSSSGSSGSGSSGSLPNTGQEQLPLLVLGTGLIVLGLLGRAFHEYWIWR